MSLWSAVPHYVSLAPSPRAAKALVRAAERAARLRRSTSTELDEAEEAYADAGERSGRLRRRDAQAYVEELERRADMVEELTEPEDLPSGESLAAELTRFLRERDERGDDPKATPPGI